MALVKNKPVDVPNDKPAPVKAAPAPDSAAIAVSSPGPITETEAAPTIRVTRKEFAGLLREKVMATNKAISPAVADVVVGAFTEVIMETLAQGGEVNLPGFGRFFVVAKAAAMKRNPATNEPVEVPAHNAPKFKIGSKLKEACNQGVDVGGEEA